MNKPRTIPYHTLSLSDTPFGQRFVQFRSFYRTLFRLHSQTEQEEVPIVQAYNGNENFSSQTSANDFQVIFSSSYYLLTDTGCHFKHFREPAGKDELLASQLHRLECSFAGPSD